ncbi:hypothetical protein ACHHYP_06361 [Achlya hypogyna]|uniref:DDE-1 domain-containing protein n=1 Tax=Achlya hypogyna TaxID=1202772 RepID=A0A1V9YUQ6_ACHHY|nr:hypothetical protein ACHHYP_06361 [Achlya hypogyna]
MCSDFLLTGYGSTASPAGIYCSEACAFGETDNYLEYCVDQGLDLERKALLTMFHSGTYANPNAFAALVMVPSATFYGWVQRSSAILAYDVQPILKGLVTFMKDMRRTDEMVTTYDMIEYVAWHHREWHTTYINSKLSPERAYLTLFRYLQRFAHRHGFRQRVPTASKIAREKLMIVRDDFARSFLRSPHAMLPAVNVYNVDETAVYYDKPPRRTWAYKGETPHASASQKNSDCITAVLTICANGEKLPVLFIVHGKPGGTIEREELPTYPPEDVYVVQENAWMDQRVWQHYLERLLRLCIRPKSVLLLDNFDAHVTPASNAYVSSALDSTLLPLPANASSALLRAQWLKERTNRQHFGSQHLTAHHKHAVVIDRVARVWRALKPETIAGSFEKALPKLT